MGTGDRSSKAATVVWADEQVSIVLYMPTFISSCMLHCSLVEAGQLPL